MAKRKANDGSEMDTPAVKLYGVPPPLSEQSIRRLQGAVDAARRERARQPKRSPKPPVDEAGPPSNVPPDLHELPD